MLTSFSALYFFTTLYRFINIKIANNQYFFFVKLLNIIIFNSIVIKVNKIFYLFLLIIRFIKFFWILIKIILWKFLI